MTTVWIYRRFRVKLFSFNEISFSFPVRRKLPTQWPEVNTAQALAFAHCMMLSKQAFDKDFETPFRLLVLNHWLGISQDDFYKLTDLQVVTLLETIEPVFETNPDFAGVDVLAGCMPENLLIEETTEAFDVYETYYQGVLHNDPGSLLAFTSFLVREQGTEISEAAANEAEGLLQGNPVLQFLLYWWYYRTRARLVCKYPGAFGKSGSSGRKGPDFTSGHGWRGLMYSVAQDGPFEDFEKLKNAEVHDFLDYLEFNHNRLKEHEWHQRQHA